jgi:hypothetical protein
MMGLTCGDGLLCDAQDFRSVPLKSLSTDQLTARLQAMQRTLESNPAVAAVLFPSPASSSTPSRSTAAPLSATG